MKNLIIIFAAIALMSFTDQKKVVWYYPDFIIKFDQQTPAKSQTAWEGFSSGKFVSGSAVNYLQGIDSVAIKYMVTVNGNRSDTYTNFYSRIGNHKWKKYNNRKQFVGIIAEYRKDTTFIDDHFPKGTVIYYTVK